MKLNGRLIIFTLVLVLMTTAFKFFLGPNLDWSGFSPVIAIALFSGMIMRNRDLSFVLPLLSVLVSDMLIQVLYTMDLFPYPGFYSGQWLNYLILLIPTLIGWMLKGKNLGSLFIGALAAPTVFFLVSNFNVWSSNLVSYSKDFDGLMACYAAGLPFYKNALIAMFVFLPLIMITYNYIARYRRQLTLA
ncbi:MAG TPA: DUF6580 family putative transport protein [Chitinophagaceae bacterium]